MRNTSVNTIQLIGVERMVSEIIKRRENFVDEGPERINWAIVR